MKRLLALAVIGATMLAACGGDSDTKSAAFEDVKVDNCVESPQDVPGVWVLGHEVKGIEDLKVCVDVSAKVGIVPRVVQYDDCTTGPCYTIELDAFDIKADEKIEITFTREGVAQDPIVYDPEPVGTQSDTGRVCVIGAGSPNPCQARVTEPKDVTATATRKAVTLQWGASIDTDNDNVLGYEVWRSDTGAEDSFQVVDTIADTTFTDTGVVRRHNYWYYVVGFDAEGNRSGSSGTVQTKTR